MTELKTPPVTRVLFVCLGNICRSPAAEGILEKWIVERGLGPGLSVESCGTNRYHKGGPADPRMVSAMAKQGYDISKHIARRYQEEDLMQFDLIFALASDVFEEMDELTSPKFKPLLREKVRTIEVSDPWYGGADGFYDCIHALEDVCKRIIQDYENLKKNET